MENRIIDPVQLGKRLRVLRGIRTRAQVQKETGISQARLGNYEHGTRIPNDQAKVILSNYYGISVQNLFFADNNNETL